MPWHRLSEVSQRLDDIPGVGPLIATALAASVPDPHAFKSGRDLAAWTAETALGMSELLNHLYDPALGLWVLVDISLCRL